MTFLTLNFAEDLDEKVILIRNTTNVTINWLIKFIIYERTTSVKFSAYYKYDMSYISIKKMETNYKKKRLHNESKVK